MSSKEFDGHLQEQDSFPYRFDGKACAACGGRCCRGMDGHVWISRQELERMAHARKMDAALFARQYVRQVQGRLSLRERVVNGEHLCCFFDMTERQCTIYESRPEQCRSFPFWEQAKEDWQALLLDCPGVEPKR